MGMRRYWDGEGGREGGREGGYGGRVGTREGGAGRREGAYRDASVLEADELVAGNPLIPMRAEQGESLVL